MKLENPEHWLKTAQPGSRFCYHEGHLAHDRERMVVYGASFRWESVPAVEAIGKLFWNAYCNGKITLTQERTGGGKFRYWAEKRRRR